MNTDQDLQAFADSTMVGVYVHPEPEPPELLRPVNVFDACQSGVVLRGVLFVQAVVAVGAMFGVNNFLEWFMRFAVLTAGALPATLVWLLACCFLGTYLGRLPLRLQRACGVALGALAGLYGCWVISLLKSFPTLPWLASAAAGAMLSAGIVAGLVWRAKARTPAATAARLTELQSRIRPHFLFNTLNSAIALVRAEPSKAEAMLEDLSELFRHALADSTESVTLAQEINVARRYLAIEEIRFGDRMQVQWLLDPAANQAKVPPLLLQPLVENAVSHGVEPSPTGAVIRVATERRGNIVVLKVTNSSPGGVGQRGHGLALANVRERLLLMHDVRAQFQTAVKDGVFQVRLEIPVADEPGARARESYKTIPQPFRG